MINNPAAANSVSAPTKKKNNKRNSNKRPRTSSGAAATISRQVSQEYLASVSDTEEVENKANDVVVAVAPVAGTVAAASGRCVAELDSGESRTVDINANGASQEMATDGNNDDNQGGSTTATTTTSDADASHDALPPLPEHPPFANPLHDAKLLAQHTRALRLEAELQPMRLILSRLMAHPTLNRKGVFNAPVDPVASKVPDYFSVIKNPMDLGTVKVRLHAVAYESRREVADDIRLVFRNAMQYNPPFNAVHVYARDLLAFFEDQVESFAPDIAVTGAGAADAPPQPKMAKVAASVEGAAATQSRSVSSTVPVPSSSSTRAEENATPLGQAPSSVVAQTSTTSISHSTRQNSFPATVPSRKRKKRGSVVVDANHACDRCEGRKCGLCEQRCLSLEPTLLICNGSACAGSRIRKGAVYFIAKDGGRQFCQRCHTGLPAVLPATGHDDIVRYKRDLLKRKNDEEIVEQWLSCCECHDSFHKACVMENDFAQPQLPNSSDYRCPNCVVASTSLPREKSFSSGKAKSVTHDTSDSYTFVCGSELPVKMSEVTDSSFKPEAGLWSSETLPETDVSAFMQQKVRDRMKLDKYPNADRTVHVRIISDCHRYFVVPEVVRKHFRMAAAADEINKGDKKLTPPTKVKYRSKAIALFQKIDGLDVCIFCMYVQEYDGNDEYESSAHSTAVAQKKRVYIAYLDSVEHFRPRLCRTECYQELLVSYLATARKRGYETAHIWACPPSRGNCFIFWNHPASQRTPNRERLIAWYHGAVSRAAGCGVVTDVQSLYDSDFRTQLQKVGTGAGRSISLESRDGQVLWCPPLLDGDFWIEEAVRIHALNMLRYAKPKAKVTPGTTTDNSNVGTSATFTSNERCPARQVAALLRDKIIPHECSLPFRRPVNAAAMNLKDYHKIVSRPMDLSTIFSRVMLGEYDTLSDLVSDVELVVSNAKRYNPEGHVVHTLADNLHTMFFEDLNKLVRLWKTNQGGTAPSSWESFARMSMDLDAVLEHTEQDRREKVSTAHLSGEAVSSPGGTTEKTAVEIIGAPEPYSSRPTETDTKSEKSICSTSDLLSGGPEAVLQRMVGEDTWLLDKTPGAPKGSFSVKGKKGVGRRRKRDTESEEEPPTKRRRQSWLGTEVGASVRKMRTSFFTCSLVAKPGGTAEEESKVLDFDEYAKDFSPSGSDPRSSTIADARHSLLEFSQFRHLEFDTLRRSKYSTAILLYYLHNNGAPGTIPMCTTCHKDIHEVRWHKLNTVHQRRHPAYVHRGLVNDSLPEELCSDCFSKMPKTSQFIPLPVSMVANH